MCMGCMGQADFLATSGILGAASLRVGARMLLRSPRRPGARAKVSDAEVSAFVASLQPDDPRAGVDADPVAAAPRSCRVAADPGVPATLAPAPAEVPRRTPVPTA